MATEACKKGHVHVNGKIAKPSREVFPMEEITVRKNQIRYELVVMDIPPSRVGAKLVDIYRKDTTPKEAYEHKKLQELSQQHYRKSGVGRPTKKDRRDIENYLDEPE